MTGKDASPEKDLLEKAATIKRFEYSSVGKELKVQTDITKKKHKWFDKVYESDETNNKSDLIYNSKDITKIIVTVKKLDKLSLKWNFSCLAKVLMI